MKHTNLLFGTLGLSMLGMLSPSAIFAQGTQDENKGSSTVVIYVPLKPKTNTSLRPKAPSMQSVMCTYDDGNLYFEFAIPEGECQLILSDSSTGEVVVEYFDSAVSEPVYVGYHRTASLTVDTENGKTYTGSW